MFPLSMPAEHQEQRAWARTALKMVLVYLVSVLVAGACFEATAPPEVAPACCSVEP